MTSRANYGIAFKPKPTKSLIVGKANIHVYDAITDDMSPSEKSFAFSITKAALDGAAEIAAKTKCQVLAGLTGTTPMVNVIHAKFLAHAEAYVRQVNNFSVISYHGRNGTVINNCTLPDGTLKPTDNQTNANRRPSDILYVKLESDISFVTVDATNQIVCPFIFYARLEVTSEAVTNSNGGAVQLTTFHGPADWHTASQATVDAIFTGPRALPEPFMLAPPEISDPNADAGIPYCTTTRDDHASTAAWFTVCDRVKRHLCPNVTEDPATVIQGITQATIDSNGKVNTMTVSAFYTALINMTTFLPVNGEWPMDVIQHFVTHVTADLRRQMLSAGYNHNAATASRAPFDQMEGLQDAFAAANIAEAVLNNIKNIAKSELSNHALMATVAQAQTHAQGLASVADRTIQNYTETVCWGCNEKGHSYAAKDGSISCPNTNRPGVIECAAAARKEYVEKLRKRNKDKNRGGRKRNNEETASANLTENTLFTGLSTSQIATLIGSAQKFRKMGLSQSPKDYVTEHTPKNFSFVIGVSVFNSVSHKPLLPISLETNLPHVQLAIGQRFGLQAAFLLSVAYDTCAALNCGSLDFHLAIAEKFPQFVKSLTHAHDKYTPVILSGIVSEGSNLPKPTTSLSVIIEYFMPYKTKEGYNTTLKIALGKDVSVNTIMGMAMIKPGKFSLDMIDDVMEPGLLDTTPFPVLYKPTIKSMPDFSNIDSSDLKALTSTTSLPHIPLEEVVAFRQSISDTAIKNTKSDHQNDPVEPFEPLVDPSNTTTMVVRDSKNRQVQFPQTAEETVSSPLPAIIQSPAKPPIIVPKQKWRAKTPSRWEEYLLDDETDFEYILRDQTAGRSLRKNTNSSFPKPNPAFHCVYDPNVDEKELMDNLILDADVSISTSNRIKSFVQEYWDVFREEGVKIPVQGYEMVIDTGRHPPIVVRKPHYGIHEAPIMQKTIDKLRKLGFIKLDCSSPWGFAITLAPKPHQEDVTDIEKYVWRFCTNYIRLNMITRPAEYPIPRCDDAVMYGFGRAMFFILLDAFSGYHQVRLSPCSSIKTAFFAPHGRKFVWVIMPFGLRNAPVVFIAMMHDLKELWTEECTKHGIVPSHDEGSTIIMDDTFLYGVSEDNAFIIVRCVCKIARKYHLTWKLKKSRWFPQSVEFVGVDLNRDGGNTPASSKHGTISAWKVPKTPREILAFLGFAIFYLRWIPWFEMKVQPLRKLVSAHLLDHVFTSDEMNTTATAVFVYIRDFLLSKPILQRANIRKRFYLKTDFSSVGLGYALCQPDDTPEAWAAMERENNGGECEFEKWITKMRLLPLAFGSRKTVGNEKHLHSHPGESLSATFGVLKCRQFLWGRPFSLLTDCRALLWLMAYNGHNHAVKRLQLEMLGFWFTIVHRPGTMMEDANFFSRLGEDIHFDPLMKDYLSFARQMYTEHSPAEDPISDNNMPGRRAKRQRQDDSEVASAGVNFAMAEWNAIDSIDQTPLTNKDLRRNVSNFPVTICSAKHVQEKSPMHYSYITETAVNIGKIRWCLSDPGHGHFIEASRTASVRFDPIIVCDRDQSCRNTMEQRYAAPFVFESISELSKFCKEATKLPTIHGYYAHLTQPKSVHLGHIETKIHEQIVQSLKDRADLQIAIFEFGWHLPANIFSALQQRLRASGWLLFNRSLNSSEHFSDRVAFGFDIMIALSNRFYGSAENINLSKLTPTPPVPNDMNPNIKSEFDLPTYALPYIGELFNIEPSSRRSPRQPAVEYVIRQKAQDLAPEFDIGFQVFDRDYPAPRPTPIPTNGLFGRLFGISYPNSAYTAKNKEPQRSIRAISAYEYATLFGYSDSFSSYLASQPNMADTLQRTIPARSMLRIVDTIQELLRSSLDSRCEEIAAYTGLDLSVSALFNGIIVDDLPDESAWKTAYDTDRGCAEMIRLVQNPARASIPSARNLKPSATSQTTIPSIYRAQMRDSQIEWKEGRLTWQEPVANSMSTIRLVIVPKDLQRHIFNAFHTNPLGGHFSLYYTLHRIRLRFHWPFMYSYIKKSIDDCAACLLRHGGARASSELLYSFPISAPFQCVHADCWVPGKTTSFDGYVGLMVVMCHMTGFVAIEPLRVLNSTTFAQSVYTILLRYGLSHTVITDPDSKFKGEFKKAFDTLKIHHHLSARGHHDAILVERFNRFLNSGLRVFDNDRETNRVFVEGATTLTYAWNSCPVLGTDLSRSLLVVGREFHFPIDFKTNTLRSFEPSDTTKRTFADDLMSLLTKSREIYTILISEHRAAHREYRNSQINNPRIFKLGDIVFTNVQVQSKKSTGTVQKLAYIKRGPYKIVKDYKSGAYELEQTNKKSVVTIKKHGSELFLSPQSLVPHRPMQSSDQIFSELNKKIIQQPYGVIGLDNYEPAQPWGAPAAVAGINMAHIRDPPPFPTLDQLDDEYDGWPESGNPFTGSRETIRVHPAEEKHTPAVAHPTSIAQSPAMVMAELIQSKDRLFFIAYSPVSTQTRREWKLVKVDLATSLKKHPACLQDGRFLVEFLIEHHRDAQLDICDRRFWLEYHKSDSHRTLATNYNILQPSQFSAQLAAERSLVSYREWIYLSDPAIRLHGPFEFATVRGRKTRDRICESDWRSLIAQSTKYHNHPPRVTGPRHIQIDVAQPCYEAVADDPEVSNRCYAFMGKLVDDDATLQDYSSISL